MKRMKYSVRWQAVLLGLGVGMISVVCGCAAGAGLVAKGAVGMDTMGLWAAGITVFSGLLGSLAALALAGGSGAAMLLRLGQGSGRKKRRRRKNR